MDTQGRRYGIRAFNLNSYLYMKTNDLIRRGLLAALCLLGALATAGAGGRVHLTILHTNDTHSQVEPLPGGSPRTPGMGGYARRMGLIAQVRAEEPNVLLLDAGDYWQGTPYFNFFNGRVEVDAMNRMGYDAATLGNHEFDNGLDTLAAVLRGARFPVVSSNYVFDHAGMANLVKPYVVVERGGLRIGIMAVNVNPEGLVMQANYRGMQWLDPVGVANETADYLKRRLGCDLVICLSHLGADEARFEPNDFSLVRRSRHIDVVIGGHSHELIADTTATNLDGRAVIIAQAGKSGAYLGRIDLVLER